MHLIQVPSDMELKIVKFEYVAGRANVSFEDHDEASNGFKKVHFY